MLTQLNLDPQPGHCILKHRANGLAVVPLNRMFQGYLNLSSICMGAYIVWSPRHCDNGRPPKDVERVRRELKLNLVVFILKM